jgi:hypothetical protein
MTYEAGGACSQAVGRPLQCLGVNPWFPTDHAFQTFFTKICRFVFATIQTKSTG